MRLLCNLTSSTAGADDAMCHSPQEVVDGASSQQLRVSTDMSDMRAEQRQMKPWGPYTWTYMITVPLTSLTF